MLTEARVYWWPSISIDNEDRKKFCVDCMASGKNLIYQTPKNETRELQTLTEPGK